MNVHRRKKEWQQRLSESIGRAGHEQFVHKLFKDAELDELFDCTAFVSTISRSKYKRG